MINNVDINYFVLSIFLYEVINSYVFLNKLGFFIVFLLNRYIFNKNF